MSQKRKQASLVLQNGQCFKGWSFGFEGPCDGEVVFSTAMVGYPESLTDPSYAGQILCVCYPLIGNYGIPRKKFDDEGVCCNFESEKIQLKALVVTDYSENYSHWDACMSLDEWMKEEKIPGICGVDTRKLTQIIREEGCMRGKIVIEGMEECPIEENSVSAVAELSCKEPLHYGQGGKRLVLVDCGVRHSILRKLSEKGVETIRVPHDYDFNSMEYDGLVISNGPGAPEACVKTIENIRKALDGDKPILGIDLGSELLALAAGAKTVKLKYGHHSHNQPVRLKDSDKCIISSQNHNYVIDSESLPEDWKILYYNMNDGSAEAVCHKTKPFYGTEDLELLFDEFISKL